MCAGGQAAPLAGGLLAFTHGKLVSPDKAGRQRTSIHPIGELIAAAAETADPEAVRACLARLVEPTHPYVDTVISGPSGRPLVMGVLNVTPDSFSDGGDYADTDTAIAHGRALHAAGADLIDVGGESTRPSATPVTVEAEICRVMPVVTALAGEEIPVSIDTRRAAVMDEAIAAGATVVNDVSALQFDPAALDVVAASAASVILMHMQGAPETMQAAPHYDDVVLDVYAALARRVAACEAAGIDRSRICVDPGIGFGKTVAHNMALISALGTFHGLGCAVAIGVSRKSFIDAVAGTTQPKDRLAGSLAAMLTALDQGAQIVRVHDVAKTVQAVALWREAQMAP
ncbi:MAG: dihydropteroate synthase [Alphaproteobacteria bacterium]|nr:dihydropteroate synthase [Alphaproteobacteria bacterium]